MEVKNSKPDLKEAITFEPVELEEIPPPSKEDLQMMLMWNMKMFPFLIRNYDAIFKGEAHSNPVHVIHSDFCPKQL